MSDAIILFSHGSTLCGAGEHLKAHAAALHARTGVQVEIGYLNYSEPLFAEAFERCVEGGAKKVTVVPYFLVAGYFVQVDLPKVLRAARDKHPNIEVRVADALRVHNSLGDALVACAERAQPPAAWRDILNTAPQFCRANPQCPLYAGPQCSVGKSHIAVAGA